MQSAYNIGATGGLVGPMVISPGRPLNSVVQLVGFIPQTPGTAGFLTFNNAKTLDEACAANQIVRIPFNLANRGLGLGLEGNPLMVSEVPKGMTVRILYRVVSIK